MRILEKDQKAADEARTRGAMYALLAWAWRYPEEESLSTLTALLRRCLSPGSSSSFDSNTQIALESVSSLLCGPNSARISLDVRFSGLFGHAVRGSCPLYELEYGHAEIVQQAGELADIAGFYSAFGLENTQESMERVDHVSVECEFMSVLCAKYAMGLLSNGTDLMDACFDGQRIFLRDHLARWFLAFCSRVVKADGDGVYGNFARLGAAYLVCECQAFGITSGPEYLELRSVDPDADTEIQCGPSAGEQLVPLTVGGLETGGE